MSTPYDRPSSSPYTPAPKARTRVVFHARENLIRAAFTAAVGALIAFSGATAVNAGFFDHDAGSGMHTIEVRID